MTNFYIVFFRPTVHFCILYFQEEPLDESVYVKHVDYLNNCEFAMSTQIFTIKIGINRCYLVKDEGTILIDFGIPGKIVYTLGHTQGSVSVLLETGEAFVGCLVHNNLPFRLRPGLPIFAEDIEKVKESWKSIIQQGAKMIYPAHGNPFSVDIIKKALI